MAVVVPEDTAAVAAVLAVKPFAPMERSTICTVTAVQAETAVMVAKALMAAS